MSAMNEDCFRKSDYQNPPLLLIAFNMKIRDTLCPSSLFCRAVEREWESRVGLKRQLVTGANSGLSLSLSLSPRFFFFFGGGGRRVGAQVKGAKTRLGFSRDNGRHNGKRFTFLPQSCPFLDLLTFYILCPFRYGLNP